MPAAKTVMSTQIMPIVDCSDYEQLNYIMEKCGFVRSEVYNRLGSLKGWQKHWKFTDKIIREKLTPEQLGIPSKIFEYSSVDCLKAISAQQDAAIHFLTLDICQKTTNDDAEERKRLIDLLYNDPTKDNWLHRKFRKQYLRGHTYLRNQVVYHKQAYKCIRISRYKVKIQVQGLERGKRITLVVKTNKLPTGQIRIIKIDGKYEIHTAFLKKVAPKPKKFERTLGLDKGYTEGFYSSENKPIAMDLGQKLTQKTERINSEYKNRNRLFAHAKLHENEQKRRNIIKHNLGKKNKTKKLNRDKQEIKAYIRQELRATLKTPALIYAEDLTSPIRNKTQSKRINRKLNNWMKGELQKSLEEICLVTGSSVKTVNPAYTSQIDYLTGTLLGVRKGDRFYRYNGDVLQSDYNAAMNILYRGTDKEITRYTKYRDVRTVLLKRTVTYLHSIDSSVSEAINNEWLHPKFESEALAIERDMFSAGVVGKIKQDQGSVSQNTTNSPDYHVNERGQYELPWF